jgi:hypothetical protein
VEERQELFAESVREGPNPKLSTAKAPRTPKEGNQAIRQLGNQHFQVA